MDKPLKLIYLLLLTGFFLLWLGVSTVIYAVFVLILGLVNYRAAYAVMKNWCWTLVTFSGISCRVEGLDKLDKNGKYVFISNHTSAYDIPVLVINIPLFMNFIAKKELFSIPMFGWALRTIGHIPVDRSSARKARVSLQKAVELVNDKNRSLIIFPEGTRSLDGKVGQFNRASFSLVKDVGIKIVPVHLSGADKVANKKSWYITPGEVKLTIGEPVDKKTVAELDKKELCNLVREKVVCLSN